MGGEKNSREQVSGTGFMEHTEGKRKAGGREGPVPGQGVPVCSGSPFAVRVTAASRLGWHCGQPARGCPLREQPTARETLPSAIFSA